MKEKLQKLKSFIKKIENRCFLSNNFAAFYHPILHQKIANAIFVANSIKRTSPKRKRKTQNKKRTSLKRKRISICVSQDLRIHLVSFQIPISHRDRTMLMVCVFSPISMIYLAAQLSFNQLIYLSILLADHVDGSRPCQPTFGTTTLGLTTFSPTTF